MTAPHRSLPLRRRAGFTLIELLVVVVIIGILSTTAMPSFIAAQDKARNAAMTTNIKKVQIGLETFGSDNKGTYPATLADASFLSSSYLPGNKLPVSPWCRNAQVVALGFTDTDWPAILTAAQQGQITAGWPTNSATFADPPAAITNFGAIRYGPGSTGDASTYRVFAMGKKLKERIPLCPLSNEGNQ
jgi:prepilin-type N-terminal cleavage/methylation domain-containing protein